MPPELDALLTLANDLYNRGQHQETLTVIENIYALYDLYQFHYNGLQVQQIVTNHDNHQYYNLEFHAVGS